MWPLVEVQQPERHVGTNVVGPLALWPLPDQPSSVPAHITGPVGRDRVPSESADFSSGDLSPSGSSTLCCYWTAASGPSELKHGHERCQEGSGMSSKNRKGFEGRRVPFLTHPRGPQSTGHRTKGTGSQSR